MRRPTTRRMRPPHDPSASVTAGQARRYLSVRAPLDVASARLILFAAVQARQSGASGVALRLIANVDDAPAAADAIGRDLAWLGIDVAPEPIRTCDRSALYSECVQRLVDTGQARTIDGAIRLVVAPGETVIDDVIRGRIVFSNDALGDIVLTDANGTIDESVAAVVDDAVLGTTFVVRDDRHLERSARGQLVGRALDVKPPRCAHVGAVLADSADGKLPTIELLRRAGFLPGPVLEHLALLGWSPPGNASAAREPLGFARLVAEFSFARISHAAAHFNEPRLRALNARALQALPAADAALLLGRSMQRAGLLEDPIPAAAERWIATFLAAFGNQFSTVGEALAIVADLRAEAVVVPALELEKLRNRHVLFYLDAVGQYVDAQAELRELPLDHDLRAIADEFGIAAADAFAAVRMALTGRREGAPLHWLFPLLGHDRILIRIGAISSHLLHGRGLEPIAFGPGGVPFQTIVPLGPPEH